jgi:hypothetical protein
MSDLQTPRIEKRHRDVRCTCELAAPGKPADGKHQWEGTAVRVSRRGIHVVAPQQFAPGSVLKVKLVRGDGSTMFTVLVCVERVSPQADGSWHMHCRFDRARPLCENAAPCTRTHPIA